MASKGLGIQTILVLTAAVLFFGLIVTIYTESPLRDLIDEGADTVGDSTGHVIEVEDRDTFSDLAMLSIHRASYRGCKGVGEENPDNPGIVKRQIDGEQLGIDIKDSWYQDHGEDGWGYPYLSGTYLGQEPGCAGADDTLMKDISPGLQTGQDMEGVFSRERFRVPDDTKKIKLNAENPDTWIEDKIVAASRNPYRQDARCDEGGVNGVSSRGFLSGGEQAGQALQSDDPRFTIHFRPEVDDDRARWMYDDVLERDSGMYCSSGVDSILKEKLKPRGRYYLCPGDEGFIQVNKGEPLNDGESGNLELFPHIEITNVDPEQECAESGSQPRIESVSLGKEEGGWFSDEKVVFKPEVENRWFERSQFSTTVVGNDEIARYDKDTKEVAGGSSRTFNLEVPIDGLEHFKEGELCYVRVELYEGSDTEESPNRLVTEPVSVNEYKPGCGSLEGSGEIEELTSKEYEVDAGPGGRPQTLVDFTATVKNTGEIGSDFRLRLDTGDEQYYSEGIRSNYQSIPAGDDKELTIEEIPKDELDCTEHSVELIIKGSLEDVDSQQISTTEVC